jgi:hypothetical protein
MNKKHLIQFVATVGAMLVLYVLSFGPVYAYASRSIMLGGRPEMERRWDRLATLQSFYRPIFWTAGHSKWFAGLSDKWIRWWMSCLP